MTTSDAGAGRYAIFEPGDEPAQHVLRCPSCHAMIGTTVGTTARDSMTTMPGMVALPALDGDPTPRYGLRRGAFLHGRSATRRALTVRHLRRGVYGGRDLRADPPRAELIIEPMFYAACRFCRRRLTVDVRRRLPPGGPPPDDERTAALRAELAEVNAERRRLKRRIRRLRKRLGAGLGT